MKKWTEKVEEFEIPKTPPPIEGAHKNVIIETLGDKM